MVASLCRGCDHTFAGLSHFDSHLDIDYKARPPRIECREPDHIGLVLNAHGQWGSPEKYSPNPDYVPAAERPAHEFDRECVVCGTIFQRPRTRGRPPTKCEECR